MGKFKLEIMLEAQEDISKHIKAGNKSVIKKLDAIFIELTENPYIGIGQPEMLKYDLLGLWSRRISKDHRLIYLVNENTVTVLILSAMGHYN
jgi:toxin YoeB